MHYLDKLPTLAASIILALAFTATAKDSPTDAARHLGPSLSVHVQRGEQRLPIYLVDHLHKGDKLLVTPDAIENKDNKWLLVMATINPAGNKVEAKKFDLSEHVEDASIDISADNLVPMFVVAPQVKTLFGLHTSFGESASLITDAIKADPQRFVDLQKVDQVDRAIALISSALEHIVQTTKPEDAVTASKALASQFGVKYVDPSCFKDNTINARCVVTSIISSDDLIMPADRTWAADGPNADAAKVPTDIFANLKLVTEATTYLANKYGDNYTFAPSSGLHQPNTGTGEIQLYTNARFKSGDVKTAYVYVPSWFGGKRPDLVLSTKAAICANHGELTLSVKGVLPLTNYWHDMVLNLRESGDGGSSAHIGNLSFKPETGKVSFDLKNSDHDLGMAGRIMDATLVGKYSFSMLPSLGFKLALPGNDNLLANIAGLDNLIAGEHAKLSLQGADGGACVEHLAFSVDGKTLAASSTDNPNELALDLERTSAGPATLEVSQFGLPKQSVAVMIKPRKVHVSQLTHFDMENRLIVHGEHLERIESIQAGHATCVPNKDTTENETTAREFTCPSDIASNNVFPNTVSIRHLDNNPAMFDVSVSKTGARPHLLADGVNAIVTLPSTKALQWDLAVDDKFVADDASLSILLHAVSGYKLSKGSYVLQLKFSEDGAVENSMSAIPLIADLTHNELRTRNPISFGKLQLPGVINPIWYRVMHQPSGLIGDWEAMNRSVVYFPQFSNLSCSADGKTMLIHGNQLETIDWVTPDLKASNTSNKAAPLVRCDQSLCLGVPKLGPENKLRVKVHWIDDRLFNVQFADAPNCGTGK